MGTESKEVELRNAAIERTKKGKEKEKETRKKYLRKVVNVR